MARVLRWRCTAACRMAASLVLGLHGREPALAQRCASSPLRFYIYTLAAAAGVLSALEAKRDALAKRTEGLIRCKEEFSALARCL